MLGLKLNHVNKRGHSRWRVGKGFIVIDIFVPLLYGLHGQSTRAPMEIDQYLFVRFFKITKKIFMKIKSGLIAMFEMIWTIYYSFRLLNKYICISYYLLTMS